MNILRAFQGGVYPPRRKTPVCDQPIITAPLPEYVVLPLLQHIGAAPQPIVGVGDKVLKGQTVAHCGVQGCEHKISAPIHASISGVVTAVEPRLVPHPAGLAAPCIVIESDGEDRWGSKTPISDYTTLTPGMLRRHIAKSGIVGLGGAGFPSHLKLEGKIHTLILNGAECEPFISCDDRLMQERAEEVLGGAQIICHALGGVRRCILALEDQSTAAYDALTTAARHFEEVNIIRTPTIYPMGGERQLIWMLTGKELGRGVLPVREGFIVHNVGTAAAIYRAIAYDEPLISRIVTVTGDAVSKPANLEVRLGAPVHSLLNFRGRLASPPARLIMGGPMMGFALASEEPPIIKTTNCLIASTAESITEHAPVMPCIRCGACEPVCPVRLLPQQLYWYSRAKDFDKVQDYHLFECIECGCCAYVCPSHIPLVHYFRYAKGEIRQIQADRRRAEHAKERYEFRLFRLNREDAERQARHRQKLMLLKAQKSQSPSQNT